MAWYDNDPYSDSYTGAGNGDIGPGAGDGPPPEHPDWIYDPLQGVYVPPPSVIGAPPQTPAQDQPTEPPPAPAPAPTPTPTPMPTTPIAPTQPGPGLLDPFPGGTLDAPAPQPLPTLAGSQTTIPGAPPVPQIPKFQAPTLEEALNEPGYLFAEQRGANQLKNWLAAHGTFNDSSAAEALTDYGRNAAATQYGNVWGRAMDSYMANVGTQYLQPWNMAYQNWQAGTVNPTLTNFQTMVPTISHANDMSWQQAYNKWMGDWGIFRDQRDSTFDKIFQTAVA